MDGALVDRVLVPRHVESARSIVFDDRVLVLGDDTTDLRPTVVWRR